MKKIILSADDFARSHERNLAIDYAMKNGLIKSAAVLMGSDYTSEAIEMASAGGYVKDIHCHLNLISGVDAGNHFMPTSDCYKNSKFSVYGEFPVMFGRDKKFNPYFSKIAYQELESQFQKFIRVTNGMANYNHVDFHIYGNLVPAVTIAYRKFIDKYRIKSARYYGEHHKEGMSIKRHVKFALKMLLSGDRAYVVKSSSIDYYLTRNGLFSNDDIIELYVHPDYVNGVLLDNTTSVFGHTKVPLQKHIEEVLMSNEIQFISWNDL